MRWNHSKAAASLLFLSPSAFLWKERKKSSSFLVPQKYKIKTIHCKQTDWFQLEPLCGFQGTETIILLVCNFWFRISPLPPFFHRCVLVVVAPSNSIPPPPHPQIWWGISIWHSIHFNIAHCLMWIVSGCTTITTQHTAHSAIQQHESNQLTIHLFSSQWSDVPKNLVSKWSPLSRSK